MSSYLREDLKGLSAYGAPQLDVPVRLNTNENSYGVPEELAGAIEKALSDEVRGLNRYPDRDAIELRADLAAYLGVAPERVWAANGSNEIQQQLLQAFAGPGRKALGFGPSYSMHPLLALGTATPWIDGGRLPDFTLSAAHVVAQIREHKPAITFLCSPNNPTGTALPLDVVRAALDERQGLIVVDEAYAEFRRPETPSALSLLDEYRHLIVTRTMSKAFAFAGARLGYLAADPSIVEGIQLVRLPYHLSALTQAAARAALAHSGQLLATVDVIKEQRDRIVTSLREDGWQVADSDANFVLFGEFADQKLAWQGLLDQGVLVRDVGLTGWLRVTAGTPEETTAFLHAMSNLESPSSGAPTRLTTEHAGSHLGAERAGSQPVAERSGSQLGAEHAGGAGSRGGGRHSGEASNQGENGADNGVQA